ncbi:hypothetical protein [Arcobacter vandammei]|uniref:hypothetical protein n=1 Tax=Arcobacter vandammei TaxID=2782243 RepID=UPI0018DFAE48|nr:hypothetical protein [Arcobacter vandammei]
MKKTKHILLILSIFILTLCSSANAYMIGGAYANLEKFDWGQFGYEYGYIGTYKVGFGTSAKYYQIYFGQNYCQY